MASAPAAHPAVTPLDRTPTTVDDLLAVIVFQYTGERPTGLGERSFSHVIGILAEYYDQVPEKDRDLPGTAELCSALEQVRKAEQAVRDAAVLTLYTSKTEVPAALLHLQAALALVTLGSALIPF